MKCGWLILFCCLEVAHADVLLRVRPHVVVPPNSEVKLAQLVDLTPLTPESREQVETISISRAPKAGEKQELSNSSLLEVLRSVVEIEHAHGHAQVHLIVPKSVIIDTAVHEMNEEQVISELIQAWQPLCVDCQLSIEALSLPQIVGLRDWALKIKAELPKGTFSVPMLVTREQGGSISAWVSGRLLAKHRVPVAKRMLGIGERIQPQDVGWEYKDTSFSYDGVPTSEELSGKRMKQNLRAGDTVFRGMLEKEKAVRRGELVQIRSHEGPWEVSLSVVASQDAFVGETIGFKNPKTNTTLMGEVVGVGEVELR